MDEEHTPERLIILYRLSYLFNNHFMYFIACLIYSNYYYFIYKFMFLMYVMN